jgi:hypothetical protein
MRLLLKWLLSAASLLFVAYIYSGVEVKSFTSALIAAFVPKKTTKKNKQTRQKNTPTQKKK